MRLGYRVLLDGQTYDGFFDPPEDGNAAAPVQACRLECPGKGPVGLHLLSALDPETGVACRRLEVKNQGSQPVTLGAAHILYELEFPHAHLSYFTSDWGSEYSPVELDVTYDVRICTQSGRSSKGCAPFFRVSSLGHAGGMLGVSVGWSGNWQAAVARQPSATNIVAVGLLEAGFSHIMQPGKAFENIEMYDAFRAGHDAEALSAAFRRYYQRHIRLPFPGMKELPVVYNDWWPYEDKFINQQAFYDNAVAAKEMGFTNTLLDAGWFGPSEMPDPDQASPWFLKRGDWHLENKVLFPDGIAALGKKIHEQAGIPFGIWCEIEAVGQEAELLDTHSQIIAKRDGQSLGYVCMGNPETRQWALDVIQKLIEAYGAQWIKFDFNLDPGQGCDCVAHGHGPQDGIWAHYRGYYAFLDEIRRRWPDVVLENCSSGGLRIDYGMMKHCHTLFLSDPDYTRHHLQCFWGALSHIHPSACYHFTQSHIVGDHNFDYDHEDVRTSLPNPITKNTPLATLDYMTRACMTGVLGFSLKLIELPPWARKRIAEHIAFYRSISWDYIVQGDLWRLTPQTTSVPGRGSSWSAFQLAADPERHLLFLLKSDRKQPSTTVRLRGLDAGTLYELRFHDGQTVRRHTGQELMGTGMRFASDEKYWSEVVEVYAI